MRATFGLHCGNAKTPFRLLLGLLVVAFACSFLCAGASAADHTVVTTGETAATSSAKAGGGGGGTIKIGPNDKKGPGGGIITVSAKTGGGGGGTIHIGS
jgi:hypothetical protein